MASPPYNLDISDPTDGSLGSAFPANERTFRDNVNSYINTEHDSATGYHKFQELTTAQKNVLGSPPKGMLVYDTTLLMLYINTGTAGAPIWTPVAPYGFSGINRQALSYAVLASDGGWLVANTGAAGIVTFTLPAAGTTGLHDGWTVGIVTQANQIISVAAGAGNTIVYPSGQSASSLTIAGRYQVLTFIYDATASQYYTTATNGFQTVLTANTSFFVNPSTGNDSNTGLTSGTAWQTLQHAWNWIQANVDFNGFQVTVSCADGTYSTGLFAQGPMAGNSQGVLGMNFIGNDTTPANCSVTDATAFQASQSTFSVSGFKVQGNSATPGFGYGIVASQGSFIIFNKINFGVCVTGHMASTVGSEVACAQLKSFGGSGSFTLSGNTTNSIVASNGATMILDNAACTVSGGPTFSSTTVLVTAAVLQAVSFTYAGASTAVRGLVTLNGVINTGRAVTNNWVADTYFPGNANGSSTKGGYYD